MQPSGFIKDVGEVDFEYEVILYSKSQPVLVYFWADWCKPCRAMEPFLEHAAEHFSTILKLVRVNTDACPNLAIRYEVRTLPTIKSFADGEVTGNLIGPQPENRIISFIQHLAPPGKFVLEVERAYGLLNRKSWREAEVEFRSVLDEEPDNAAALAGLIKSLLPQDQPGKAREALNLLDVFPPSRYYNSVELIRPLAEELVFSLEDSTDDSDEFLPAYLNSLLLFRKGRIPSSIDGLLDILRSSRNYRQGKARKVILGILEIMGADDPSSADYRAELASILF